MSGQGSVLIADDEVNLCRVLNAEFHSAGYDVVCVHDGLKAVEEAGSNDYSVILLDVRMPGMDGLNALREIRRMNADTPIIMMTAYESPDVVNRSLAGGACICVTKPFDLENMTAFVKASLKEDVEPTNNLL